jgi:hypothetical protein
VNVRNKIIFYGEELLAPRPTPKVEDHPLSAVRDCLFNIFAATLHICRPSAPSVILLHNEELHNLYSLPNRMIKSRRMRWAGHVARMEAKRNACRILVGKTEGKRPPGRPRRRWVYNIKIDLREIGWNGVDWIDLTQVRD